MAAQFKVRSNVVLLGEGCVGKTSIVLRYCQQTFNENHVTTIQDTAGQERFHALGPIYYRNSHGAVLVYDITDQDSFQKVKNWVRELKKMLGTNIAITICGNKSDLERQRTVSQEEAEAYAQSVGAKHFQTSARLNRGIEEMFLDLAKRLIQDTPRAPKATSRVSVLVEDDEPKAESKSGCC